MFSTSAVDGPIARTTDHGFSDLLFFVSRGDENVAWACNTIMLLSDREAMMRQSGLCPGF